VNLYISADEVGTATGGGLVTRQERDALAELPGPLVEITGLSKLTTDPFGQDRMALARVKELAGRPSIAHCYSGCLTETVRHLRSVGTKVTYTAAAHSVEDSRKEHEFLGIPYDYPHLTDRQLFHKYVGGYRQASRLICPSRHSAQVMLGFGCPDAAVIPHGCHPVPEGPPPPKNFTLGYLGAVGPDKGLVYLFLAWKKLGYRDAVLKVGGKFSTSDFCRSLLRSFGGGNIVLAGWQDRAEDFYHSLSAYCQPSASEGFGIEVLEALACGRPVVCSDGAGAADVLTPEVGRVFVARNVPELADYIDSYRRAPGYGAYAADPHLCRAVARDYTWDKIRQRYIDLWRSL
jgi:glycosyltransferase involved in cell wall biosynthesis